MTKNEKDKIEKLASYIKEHLGSSEDYNRGETYITWFNRSNYDYQLSLNISDFSPIFLEMADNIIKFLNQLLEEKNETKKRNQIRAS